MYFEREEKGCLVVYHLSVSSQGLARKQVPNKYQRKEEGREGRRGGQREWGKDGEGKKVCLLHQRPRKECPVENCPEKSLGHGPRLADEDTLRNLNAVNLQGVEKKQSGTGKEGKRKIKQKQNKGEEVDLDLEEIVAWSVAWAMFLV